MAGGQVPDGLIAEHGFSMLVTVVKGGREHRLLFDAGTSPDGVAQNMRRLDIDHPQSRPSSAATATSTTRPGSTG
jgi:7,8-dihydropterin-6-yl-methyl-4-(beta-D-ribofuranosyl)aminobenzene 5'-phosphate synthase